MGRVEHIYEQNIHIYLRCFTGALQEHDSEEDKRNQKVRVRLVLRAGPGSASGAGAIL